MDRSGRASLNAEELRSSDARSAPHLVAVIALEMAKRGSGRIISVGSMAGQIGLAGGTAYRATKIASSGRRFGPTEESPARLRCPAGSMSGLPNPSRT